jgi:hypothetical protein
LYPVTLRATVVRTGPVDIEMCRLGDTASVRGVVPSVPVKLSSQAAKPILETYVARGAPCPLMSDVLLRDVIEVDLPLFFDQQLDPEANRMAAFTARNRDAFMSHWTRILVQCAETITIKTIPSLARATAKLSRIRSAGGWWSRTSTSILSAPTRSTTTRSRMGSQDLGPISTATARRHSPSWRGSWPCGWGRARSRPTAGSFVVVRWGVVHQSSSPETDSTRMLLILSPAGMDHLYDEAAEGRIPLQAARPIRRSWRSSRPVPRGTATSSRIYRQNRRIHVCGSRYVATNRATSLTC